MRKVKTLGLLGTGVIGAGWAARALHFGIDVIAADYRAARAVNDAAAMARFQNEEACVVPLSVLEALARDDGSFIHRVALKGGAARLARTLAEARAQAGGSPGRASR